MYDIRHSKLSMRTYANVWKRVKAPSISKYGLSENEIHRDVYSNAWKVFHATCSMWWIRRKYFQRHRGDYASEQNYVEANHISINISLLLILWQQINKSNGYMHWMVNRKNIFSFTWMKIYSEIYWNWWVLTVKIHWRLIRPSFLMKFPTIPKHRKFL